MKLKLLFFLSVCIVILSIVYIVDLLNQDFVLNKDDEYKSTINIWITTPGLSEPLKRFQSESSIKVNVKQFNDMDALIEELELSNVNSKPPDVVEVNSYYGMDEIISENDTYAIEEISGGISKQFQNSIINNFSYDNKIYAYPLGIEIPLIFINRSILNNHLSAEATISPFEAEATLEEYKQVQNKINNNNNTKPFWLFHFDKKVPLYWDANVISKMDMPNYTFEKTWRNLINKYELVPPLDHHMAITRFANWEVGALISTSLHIHIIQELIGNSFEFEVIPLASNNDPILVSGNGFLALSQKNKVEELFRYISGEDVQEDFLSKTGWFPAQKSLFEDSAFMNDLPMSKYLNDLTQFKNQFIGSEFKESSRKHWMFIRNKAQTIEKSN